MVRSSSANRRASRCTLVTSGHVASISSSSAGCRIGVDRRGRAVGGKDHDRRLGHLVELVDEDGALVLQVAHHVEVVDDLLADVHGTTVLLERSLDRIHGSFDARAIPSRSRQQDRSHAPIVPIAGPWARRPGPARKAPGCRMSVGRARVVAVGFGPSGPVLLRTTRASHLPRVCLACVYAWEKGISDRGRRRSHRRGRDQEVMRTPTT